MASSKSSSARSRKKGSRRIATKSRARKTNASGKSRSSTQLSAATKKRIDGLPEHAKHIYKQAHASALQEYKDPSKRRGGKRQSQEQVAHKVAWAAVKKEYEKKGNEWVRKG